MSSTQTAYGIKAKGGKENLMPCETYTPGELAAIANQEMRKVKKEINKLTRLLCEIFGSESWPGTPMTDEMKEWWEEHQEADRKREAIKEEKMLEREKDRLQKINRLKKEIGKLQDKEPFELAQAGS